HSPARDPREEGQMERKWGKTQTAAYLVLGTLALANGGCLVAAVGAGAAGAAVGGYVYLKGTVVSSYQAGFEETWAATLGALNDLRMPVVQAQKEGIQGTIESRAPGDERVHIAVEPQPSTIPG